MNRWHLFGLALCIAVPVLFWSMVIYVAGHFVVKFW